MAPHIPRFFKLIPICCVWMVSLAIPLTFPLAVYGADTAGNVRPSTTGSEAKTAVKIAVLAFRGEHEAHRKWRPTADYLTQRMPGHVFHIVPLSLADMKTAVQNEQVDFILTNPGDYVEHESLHGVTRIATLRPSTYQSAGNRFGAVIFTRSDQDAITTIQDLKDKRFMAIRENAFGGFQMAWREMKAQGLDPFDDLAALEFVGFPQDKVIEAVLAGDADAGTDQPYLSGPVSMRDSGPFDRLVVTTVA